MKLEKVFILFLTIIATACARSTENTELDKGPLLGNIAFNLAIPSFENSLKEFENLEQKLGAFKDDKSEIALEDLQNSWKKAALSWAKTAPYRFGPIDDLLIENQFYYFPIDTTKLNLSISAFNGDPTVMQSLGSNIQGLGALEYLLFEKQAIDNRNQIVFLHMLARNLVALSRTVLNEWKEGYGEEFANNKGSELNSSLTKLTNQWIEVIDYIKGDEIGRPAGKTVGVEKNIYNLQAPYSHISSELIEAKVFALQQSFVGGDGKGLDDYLNTLDIKLSDNLPMAEKLNLQMETILSNLASDKSLATLITSESKKVDQLYLEALNLSIMFKTDMMGQLGLVTTFSDTDGD